MNRVSVRTSPRTLVVRRALGVLAAVALVVGIVVVIPGSTPTTPTAAGSPGVAVQVSPVLPDRTPAKNGATKPFTATEVSWPQATSATVRLTAQRTPAGSSPVWVQRLTGSLPTAHVTVLPHDKATALGVSGVVVTVSGGAGGGGQAKVGVNYRGFGQEYGGNYGSRLRAVSLPPCALTTPTVAACRTQTPLPSSQNDAVTQTVTAQVPLGAATVVLAADADPGTEGAPAGSYAATSLRPAQSWNEGGDSGSFNYSYPISLPASSSALAPTVSLSYDSQEVDGQTAVSSAQSSWAGDGWATPDSFIEQSFITCSDSPEGVPLKSPEATGDECYDGPVLTLSLGGSSTSLVCDAAESQCTPQSDDGATVQHVTYSGNGSGTYNTDYWVVTERNGEKYYFGRNELPGYASGDRTTNSVDSEPVYSWNSGDPCNAMAGSVCTMAYRWHLDYVTSLTGQAIAYYYTQTTNYYGEDNDAQPVSYISDSYPAEIDYGFADGDAYGASTPVPDKVLFTPSANGRCVQSSCTSLTSSSMTSKIAGQQYPDVPTDLYCPNNTTGGLCTSFPTSPSFFSLNRLASITTQQYSKAASPYQNVDTYTLTQTEPTTGDTTNSTLWLSGIKHTGDDTTAGGSASIDMPSETFGGVDLANRVDTANFPALERYRLESITSEYGAQTTITYGNPDPCTVAYVRAQTAATAASNTNSCYPVYWTQTGSGGSSQVMDWFESYAVQQVLVHDPTGHSLTQETDYSYGGGAAWHYDDNEVVQPKYRTYGQFRGYGTVTTYTGDTANDPQTEQVDTYYRGMDGDWLSATANRSVTLTDTHGGPHADSDPLAGDVLESEVYNGSGGPLASDTITSYWTSGAVQTRDRSGLPALTAQASGVAETWKSQVDTDGGETGVTTVTETDQTYDATPTDANFALLEYSYTHTVPVNAAYDSCTTMQYAPANTTENLVGLESYQETDSVACNGFTEGSPPSAPSATNTLSAPSAAAVAAPTHVESAAQTFYDDPTFDTAFPQTTAPTLGEPTMTRRECGYAAPACVAQWQTQSRDTYDGYGRVQNSYDANGNETSIAYAVNSVGLTTGETITAPSTNGVAHVSSKTFDPTRNLTLTSTDQNGIVTTEQYDALGRVTAMWGESKATSQAADELFGYTISNSSISGSTVQKLNNEGDYVTTVTMVDSLGRSRQVQTQTPQGGRLISDTLYDSRGWVSTKNTDYWEPTTDPTMALVSVADNQSTDQDDYVYNGLGAQVEDVSKDDAQVVSTSVMVDNGDSTTVIPDIPGTPASGPVPASGGGVVKTTHTDPLGRTTSLVEYTANPSLSIPSNTFTGTFYVTGGTTDTTSYGYDGHGNQDSITDGAADTWTQTYNLLGEQTSATDPDAGTSTTSYDADGNVLQTQDAEGHDTSYTYDALGRKTAEYAAPSNAQVGYTSPGSPGNQTASWVYDNANGAITGTAPDYPIGQATTETAYSGGNPYIEQSLGYNVFGESAGTDVRIPSAQGSTLGTDWTFQEYYSPSAGLPEQLNYPKGGGLPAEQVTLTYTTPLDLPDTVGSDQPGVGYAGSSNYTDLSQVESTEYGTKSSYAQVTDSYDPHTGQPTNELLTRSSDKSDIDSLTYGYDTSGQTTSETDQRSGSASATETQCYTYTTQAQLSAAWTATDNCAATPTTGSHTTVGDAIGTSSAYWETWSYNPNGTQQAETQYNPTTGATATTADTYGTSGQPTTLTSTSGGQGGATSYAYDADGQQTERTNAAGSQNLTWNTQGELTAVTSGSAGESYIYDASGKLLLEEDPTTTTLYLPGEQVTVTTATGAVTSAQRYYSLPGGGTAVRTGNGDSYGFELSSDQHGTNTLALDYTAQNPTWRQFDPYGNARGATVTWADNRGFLNAPTDTNTSLTDIGARWYDPITGSFISLDPALEAADPTQLGGYDYAGNDPVSGSDPTGQMMEGPAGTQCGNASSCAIAAQTGDQAEQNEQQYQYNQAASQAYSTCHGGGCMININNQLTTNPSYVAEQYQAAQEAAAARQYWTDQEQAQAQQSHGFWSSVVNITHEAMNEISNIAPVLDMAALELSWVPVVGEALDAAALVANGIAIADSVWNGVDAIENGDGWGAALDFGGAALGMIGMGGDFSAAGDDSSLMSAVSCNSFAGTTGVLMTNGQTEPISDVKVGDKISDAQPGAPAGTPNQTHTVTAVHVTHTDKNYTDVTIASPGGGQATITGTANHLYWDATREAWTQADNLKPGDLLQTSNGQTIQILTIRDYTTTMVTYNLTIDNLHTYYVVAGSTALLVHNCDPAKDFSVPNTPGVYTIHLNSGEKYVGMSTTSIRGRVAASIKAGHAVTKAGYTCSDICNVTWMDLPSGVTSSTARRVEQSVMEGWKDKGVSIVNIRDPEIDVAGLGGVSNWG